MSTTMLYKYPGPHKLQDGDYDHVTVPDEQIEDKLREGWHLTFPDARKAHEDEQAAKAAKAAKKAKAED